VKLRLHLLVAHPIVHVPARVVHPARQGLPAAQAHRDDVADRVRVERAQLPVPPDFDAADQVQQRGVGEPLRVELPVRDLPVRQRGGDDVGEAVVGGLAALGPPLLRLAADDVHRRVVALDQHRLDVIDATDLLPKRQGRFDGALGVILDRPAFDAGPGDHEPVGRDTRRGRVGGERRGDRQRPAHEFLKALLALEDRRRPGHPAAGQQRGEHAVPSGVGEGAALPV
jgi:hypothetical protein